MRLTFEGEHRSGKGTQIGLHKDANPNLLIIRGDGSYQGGLEGVLSADEIKLREELNGRLYEKNTETVKQHLWAIAARLCVEVVAESKLQDRDILIDRGPLSRASFLLSNGLEGKELLDSMYPEYRLDTLEGVAEVSRVDIESIDFGKIYYLKVPTSVLLGRMSNEDPKYEFRKKNIIEKEGLFEKAIEQMPRSVQSIIEVIDGNQSPEDVFNSYNS